MNSTERLILNTIEKNQMIPPNGKIIIGLSGGADSITLANFLSEHFSRERILCVHVNHGLRDKEAERDEKFVCDWCGRRNLKLKVFHEDIAAAAKENGEGLEECGRRIRYSLFEREADDENDRIATAHTLSDSCETILLHMVQGAGSRGMVGILPVRGKIIRPLISITRQQVEEYCSEHSLNYVTDSTNFDIAYARNRIRREIVPQLKALNPSVERSFERLSQNIARDNNELEKQAEEALKKSLTSSPHVLLEEQLKKTPSAVLMRTLQRFFKQNGCKRLQENHLLQAEKCVKNGKGSVSLPGKVSFLVSQNEARLVKRTIKQPFCKEVTLPRTLTDDGRTFIIESYPNNPLKNHQNFHKLLFNNLVDYDTIKSNLYLRNRREGDFFIPAGRNVTKSLKKLFNEAKIPVSKRESLLILESEGEIVWIEQFGVSENNRVKEETCNVVQIKIQSDEISGKF